MFRSFIAAAEEPIRYGFGVFIVIGAEILRSHPSC